MVTIFTVAEPPFIKEELSGAPNRLEACTSAAKAGVSGPIFTGWALPAELATSCRRASTRNRAKKIGIWISIGKHEDSGLVPCLRYSAIISSRIRSCDAGSFLPLYLFCRARSSGCMACIPREERICFTNSGMISTRTATVRPTIDSTQAGPGPSLIPMATSSLWMVTITQASATFSGISSPSIKFSFYGQPSWPCRVCGASWPAAALGTWKRATSLG